MTNRGLPTTVDRSHNVSVIVLTVIIMAAYNKSYLYCYSVLRCIVQRLETISALTRLQPTSTKS
jgi:general stress protein CsbA